MVTGTLKVERAKTSKPRTDWQFLPAHRRTPHRRNDRATRTDTPRAAPKTIAEKWRIGSGFDHSSPARERGPGRHTCIGVSKICTVSFARRLPRVVARRYSKQYYRIEKPLPFIYDESESKCPLRHIRATVFFIGATREGIVKHLVGAGVAITAIMAATGWAMAADMPLRAVAPAAAFDWSGMYIGGVVGGAWATNDVATPGLGVLGTAVGVPVIQTTNSSGFIGGVEGGSNYQFGNLVVGWEGDITWGGVNGTSTSGFGAPLLAPGVLNRSTSADTNWIATATSRVGIAHNNWLVYGKAGVAWANTNYTDNWAATGGPALFSGTGSSTQTGWTVGTGIEWAFWNNWSVKAEYDYLDFGNKTVTLNGSVLPGGPAIPVALGVQNSQHINEFKAGLNWRFAPNYW
jgi:outer membrane immunogenic protein